MAFHWQAVDGPILFVFRSSLPQQVKRKNVVKVGLSLTILSGSSHDLSSIRLLFNFIRNPKIKIIFTCVALAKAGLVVGPLRLSGHLSIRPSVHPSTTL